MLSWVTSTPFGVPVLPEVCIRYATALPPGASTGAGSAAGSSTGSGCSSAGATPAVLASQTTSFGAAPSRIDAMRPGGFMASTGT